MNMEKMVGQLKLPKLTSKTHSLTYQPSTRTDTSCMSLHNYLCQVREHQQSVRIRNQDKKQQGIRNMSKLKRQLHTLVKLQTRRIDERERFGSGIDEQQFIQEEKICLTLYSYDPLYKPPHRYRTALVYQDEQLFLFGGFGREKYLGLAKLSIGSEKWEQPKMEEKTDLSVFGHTMCVYKRFSYVYGGVRNDSPTCELLQINLKTSVQVQLSQAPFRRRDHAATMLTRYMVVQGGIDGSNQVNNSLFCLDTQSCRWTIPQQYQMPFLSHHSLVAIPQKHRKKNYSFYDVLGENLYIFGGKTEKDVSSNRLYKVKARESGDLTTEEIVARGSPFPRHSACVQYIDPCYICVYGGRGDDQSQSHHTSKGIFNDLNLFNVEKKEWFEPVVSAGIELPFRFGASSASTKNMLFIFGGNQANSYSDGTLLELVFSKEGEEQQVQEVITGKGKFRV